MTWTDKRPWTLSRPAPQALWAQSDQRRARYL